LFNAPIHELLKRQLPHKTECLRQAKLVHQKHLKRLRTIRAHAARLNNERNAREQRIWLRQELETTLARRMARWPQVNQEGAFPRT
jgi:hypothetical protein